MEKNKRKESEIFGHAKLYECKLDQFRDRSVG
jgi:hypothetical protein